MTAKSEHIVASFDEMMKALSAGLRRMGALAVAQLSAAIKALELRDLALAKRAQRSDAEIDALYEETEARVVRILALRQPLAVDLRETIAALQIARDLERIGDLAKNIGKRADIVVKNAANGEIRALVGMGREAMTLVADVMDAYDGGDVEKVLRVWHADGQLDELCNDTFKVILTSMAGDRRKVEALSQMLFVAKNLERVGDHATNIAEAVHYILRGVKIGDDRPKGDRTFGLALGADRPD